MPVTGAHVDAREIHARRDTEPIAKRKQVDGGIILPEPTLASSNMCFSDGVSPTIVSASTPINAQPLLQRESSQGEHDAVAGVDAAMLTIIANDDKVTLMSSQVKCSRDECLFYLESTNYDLEKAISIYKGFSMD